MVKWIRLLVALSLALVPSLASADGGKLRAQDLRCESLRAPLGIDVEAPRLSWKLSSAERGARQTAWQILVASSVELLAQDRGDLWDSGKVAGERGDQQLHIPYAGRPLASAETVYWKVRVWDQDQTESAWSAPAQWTMGALRPEDWKAHWITDPDLLRRVRPRLGYSSRVAADEQTQKWIQLDLGETRVIDTVRLYAVTHTVSERLGFPRYFRVELSEDAARTTSTVIADYTTEPFRNSWASQITIDAKGAKGRYLTLTTTRLRMMLDDTGDPVDGGPVSSRTEVGRLTLSQIEVLSGGKNVAPGSRIAVSDSLETERWSAQAMIDGVGLPGQNERANQTLLARREFVVKPKLTRAILLFSGQGSAAAEVNGAAVTATRLGPGWTEPTKTCLYETHDVTALLKPGANAIGFTLGGGMYNVQRSANRYTKFSGPFRPLVVIGQLRLEYADGSVETIVTDPTWKVAPGPITFSNVYGGEDYDATRAVPSWSRAGFDDSRWSSAVQTSGPGGALRGVTVAAPPQVAHETLQPVAVHGLKPGIQVYDFGQNAAVMLRLRVHGGRGSTITIIPAERLNDDGTLDRRSLGAGKDVIALNYRLAGSSEGESWSPKFFSIGSRYFEVRAEAPAGEALPTVEKLEAEVMHADASPAGEFACSNELFNRVRTLVRWAQRSNMASVLSDCPHRERLGWLEQTHLNGPAIRYEFDLESFYRKIFNDIADAQRADGLVPDIAPEYVKFDGGFRDSPEWGAACILAAWQQFIWTGDELSLRRHYSGMKRYFEYLASRAKDDILSHGLGDWYDLGPNPPGVAQLTPIPVTATAFYFECANTLGQIARQLGNVSDGEYFSRRAGEISAAFNRAFAQTQLGLYATGSQTAQAIPLVMGLVPELQRGFAFEKLVADVQRHGNALTSGDVGYRYLLRALADGGRSDVIFAMNAQTEKPGYGYQLAKGATSLTEAWDANPRSSQNHFMLGQITEWLYGDLAGIAPDPSGPGFKRILIRPAPVGDVKWARASYESPYGRIAVRWERNASRFTLELTVPPNTTATVALPKQTGSAARVLESGELAEKQSGLRHVAEEPARSVWEVPSGQYRFEVL